VEFNQTNCEIQIRLLKEALNQVGVCCPKDAAEVWASGLVNRSAALQYAVMTEALKVEYARQLETNAPNWVTGISSPWVSGYRTVDIKFPDTDSSTIELRFSTATSTGPAGDYNAVLNIVREDCFWRIADISMEEGLFPYTGFHP